MELIAEEYKQTEVGLIPVDWEVLKISECSSRITDGEHLTPKRTKSGYYLLSARNILNGRIDVCDVDYVGEEEFKRIRLRCNPEYGDVLISCSGSIGRVATVPKNFACVMVRSAALVKPNYSKSTGLYIQYFLQSSIGQNQIFTSMNQGAQPNLFLNHIQGLRIVLPSLPEQTAIATALSDADALISSLEKLITKKRNIKQGAMQKLLDPKEGWEVKTYGDIFDFLSTASYSRAELTEIDSIGYVHYGDIHTKWNSFLNLDKSNLPTIPHNQLKGYHYLQEGDLIMADASEDYEGIGKSVEVLNLGSRKIISGLHTFLLRDRN
jgi:type I restriction enzyme, S subunit